VGAEIGTKSSVTSVRYRILCMPSDADRPQKAVPRKALTAGGWQKPTAPPIRVASQAMLPLPAAPQHVHQQPQIIFMSAKDKPKPKT